MVAADLDLLAKSMLHPPVLVSVLVLLVGAGAVAGSDLKAEAGGLVAEAPSQSWAVEVAGVDMPGKILPSAELVLRQVNLRDHVLPMPEVLPQPREPMQGGEGGAKVAVGVGGETAKVKAEVAEAGEGVS